MIQKIMASQRLDLANRNHQGNPDDTKKKNMCSKTFKEVFARELAVTSRVPGVRGGIRRNYKKRIAIPIVSQQVDNLSCCLTVKQQNYIKNKGILSQNENT